jgi:putative flippase GtrA
MRRMRRLFRATPDSDLLRNMVRYGAVAGSGYLLAVVFYSSELAIGIAPYAAFGAAFVLNGSYNFMLVRFWAFPPSGRRLHSDLSRFGLVAVLSLIVNYTSFAILYSAISLGATTAQRLAILIAAPVTFFANRSWSFRRPTIDARVSGSRCGRGDLGEE